MSLKFSEFVEEVRKIVENEEIVLEKEFEEYKDDLKKLWSKGKEPEDALEILG